ncbi:hypothetical protein ACQJBY_041828 [Aegilops geniculata]
MPELASIPCSSNKRARGTSDGVDRLSSLPDELLHCVMSFLPMPEAVRTSLLSRRWRNLWASTPYIRIDHQDFTGDGKLKKFGDRLLLMRDGTTSLDEAWISTHNAADSPACCEWIRQAIMHKVRLLHVSASVLLDSTAMSPSQHLKTVMLQSNLLRHGFFRPLNCDCPVLEHLELEHCGLWDLKEISSRSLKVLRIIDCHIFDGLVICASNLTHVSIVNPSCDPGAMVTRDLSSLVTASVSLTSRFHYYKRNTIADHHLLDGLSHATTLELHAPLPELSFERSLRTCPTFSNLTSLVLGEWCMAADLYPLLRIHRRSCKLKELKLKLTMEEFSTCKDSEPTPSSTSGALLSGSISHPCIQRVKIYCHEDDPRVGSLVQALQPIVGDVKIIIEHR